MQFVKSGGTLLEFHNANGIVFYEPGAKLGPGVVKPNRPAPVTLVRLPEITACPGVGPFRFVAAACTRSVERTGGSTAHPRVLVARGTAGEIVTLTGKGFARTIEVRFLGQTGGSRAAGFPRGFGPRAQGGGSRGGCHDRSAAPDRRDQPRDWRSLSRGIRRFAPPPLPGSGAIRRSSAQALLWIGSGDMVSSVASQSIFISPGRTGHPGRGEPRLLHPARRPAGRFRRKPNSRLLRARRDRSRSAQTSADRRAGPGHRAQPRRPAFRDCARSIRPSVTRHFWDNAMNQSRPTSPAVEYSDR